MTLDFARAATYDHFFDATTGSAGPRTPVLFDSPKEGRKGANRGLKRMPANSLGTNFCQLHFSRKRRPLREKMPIWWHGTGKDMKRCPLDGKRCQLDGKRRPLFSKDEQRRPLLKKTPKRQFFSKWALISDNSKDQVCTTRCCGSTIQIRKKHSSKSQKIRG